MKITLSLYIAVFLFGSLESSSYRLLWVNPWDTPGASGKRVNCAISLPTVAGINPIKKAICEAVYREHLDRYQIITILVFYGLMDSSKNPHDWGGYENRIAAYLSNSGGKPGRLMILRNEKGDLLNKTLNIDFDHNKECGGILSTQ